jgi:hypothetical protein
MASSICVYAALRWREDRVPIPGITLFIEESNVNWVWSGRKSELHWILQRRTNKGNMHMNYIKRSNHSLHVGTANNKTTGIRAKTETWVVPNNERVMLKTICIMTLRSWRTSASLSPYRAQIFIDSQLVGRKVIQRFRWIIQSFLLYLNPSAPFYLVSSCLL